MNHQKSRHLQNQEDLDTTWGTTFAQTIDAPKHAVMQVKSQSEYLKNNRAGTAQVHNILALKNSEI